MIMLFHKSAVALVALALMAGALVAQERAKDKDGAKDKKDPTAVTGTPVKVVKLNPEFGLDFMHKRFPGNSLTAFRFQDCSQ